MKHEPTIEEDPCTHESETVIYTHQYDFTDPTTLRCQEKSCDDKIIVLITPRSQLLLSLFMLGRLAKNGAAYLEASSPTAAGHTLH